jgi:hypothetical protein
VREELNRRLADGGPGKGLVAWLNGHPKVKAEQQREEMQAKERELR